MTGLHVVRRHSPLPPSMPWTAERAVDRAAWAALTLAGGTWLGIALEVPGVLKGFVIIAAALAAATQLPVSILPLIRLLSTGWVAVAGALTTIMLSLMFDRGPLEGADERDWQAVTGALIISVVATWIAELRVQNHDSLETARRDHEAAARHEALLEAIRGVRRDTQRASAIGARTGTLHSRAHGGPAANRRCARGRGHPQRDRH